MLQIKTYTYLQLYFQIGFLHYDTSENVMRILQGRIKPIIIEDNSINSMYGASLHSVDVSCDGYSELLVGAPAQTNDLVMYEHGAVHFYLGGRGVFMLFYHFLPSFYYVLLSYCFYFRNVWKV